LRCCVSVVVFTVLAATLALAPAVSHVRGSFLWCGAPSHLAERCCLSWFASLHSKICTSPAPSVYQQPRRAALHRREQRCVACCDYPRAPLTLVLCSLLLFSQGTMLSLSAPKVHARAALVPPTRSTVCCSIMRGPRGVLVPSQTGGATYGVSRRAFLAGQDLVSARSSFVTRPLRSSCRKLPGVLTVRLEAGVETCLDLRSFPSLGIGECFTWSARDRLGQAHGHCGGAI